MRNTDNQAKQEARDQLAKDVAEFERRNGPIETQPITPFMPKPLTQKQMADRAFK